jgi:hypothetical protein
VLPAVVPQLVANNGLTALRAAIADPERYVVEPKVDGVRGLVRFGDGGRLDTCNRHGVRRDWLRGDEFEKGLRRLGDRLPVLWEGTVLDGELTTGRFATTMSACSVRRPTGTASASSRSTFRSSPASIWGHALTGATWPVGAVGPGIRCADGALTPRRAD